MINIPRGATSRVQLLDVVVNKPFKNYVRELFEKHIAENLESYVERTLSVAKRRILTTKWVADAWENVQKPLDMTKHYFLKCGLSNKLDGTENDQIKIRGIEDYTMPSAEREFTLLDDDGENEYEKEFTEVDTNYSNDLTESDSGLESD